MKKALLVLAALAGGLLLLVGLLLARLVLKKPALRPPSAERIEPTPERLARGQYLVEHVAACFDCHSERDPTKFGMPETPGGRGKGGFVFDEKLDFPGVVAAANITSDPETGLGKWTDGEILRALREGIDREGNVIFPMMPYSYYRSLADEDARSIVAFLRTLPPIRSQTPASRINFPVNLFIKSVPQPVTQPVERPDPSKDPRAYGRYLVTIGGCLDCHTPHEKGEPVKGKELTGGWEMKGPWGRVITPNLTPHPDTWVGRSTKAEFVKRFKSYAPLTGAGAVPAKPGLNTVMPWLPFSGMSEEDLGFIWDYIQTVPPVPGYLDPFPDSKATRAGS
jgi:mono/diheme cytochrome c family protein